MDGLNFDVLDRADYSTSYDSTYHATQARAAAFSHALDEARNDPRANANAGGAQATSGAHGSNPPQTPIVLTAAAVGGTSSPPPDKEWASRLARDPSSLANKSADQIAAEFNAHGYPATLQQSTQGSGKAQMVRISKGPINQVEVHPGEGSHGGAYTKVSTSEGKFKYVDPNTYVRRSPEPKTKFFDSRTGKPIAEDSLPLRGSGSQPGAKPPTNNAPGDGPKVEGGTSSGKPGAAAGGEGAGEGGAAAEALGKAGKVLLPIGIAASAWQLGQAFHQDGNRIGVHTGEAAAGVAGGWGGAMAGAEGGAAAGAAIGSVVPGVGTAVGGVVGGVIGGIAGGIGGDWVGQHAFGWAKSLF